MSSPPAARSVTAPSPPMGTRRGGIELTGHTATRLPGEPIARRCAGRGRRSRDGPTRLSQGFQPLPRARGHCAAGRPDGGLPARVTGDGVANKRPGTSKSGPKCQVRQAVAVAAWVAVMASRRRTAWIHTLTVRMAFILPTRRVGTCGACEWGQFGGATVNWATSVIVIGPRSGSVTTIVLAHWKSRPWRPLALLCPAP